MSVRPFAFLALLAALLAFGGVSTPVWAQSGPGGVEDTDGSSNLKLWLEADEDVSTSSGRVDSWADQSGYGSGADTSGSARPVLKPGVVNGKPVVRFDGTDDVITGNSVLAGGTTGRTILLVSEPNSTGDIKPFALNYSNRGGGKGKNYTPTPEVRVRTGGSYRKFEESQPTGDFSVLTFRNASGASVKGIQGFTNGAPLQDGKNDDKAGGTTLNIKGDDYALGNLKGFPGIDLYYDGDVAEAIVFDKRLSEAERIAAENYLASKYGLSSFLSRDKFAHDSRYGTDVAGVGQAFDGSIQSTAYSDILRITGPKSTSNSEFLFYGHDGAEAESWTTAGAPSSDFQRIARTWKFDETGGDTGDLTVQVDTTELPAPPSGYTKYYAIVSADNDFATRGDQSLIELTQVDGPIYEATGINVDDDHHLTYAVGTSAAAPQGVAAESDLNERIKLSFSEVTTNAAGLTTTLAGDQYNVYIDSRDNGGFSFSNATQLTRGTDYTISTSSGTVTANVTQDQGEDNGVGTTGLDNGTDYALWVTAVNEVGESATSSQATATPALKVLFESSSSTGSEKSDADDFQVKLSDTNSQDVSVDLAIAPDGQSPFDGTSLRSVSSITVVSGGNGYGVGDIIGEDDGTDGGSGLQIEVTSVDGNGTITGADLVAGGSGYTSPPASFTALSGEGSGADFDLTLQSSAADYNLKTTTATVNSGNLTTTVDKGDLVFENDKIPENTETVELSLSNPRTSNTTASLGSRKTHDVDISDNDLERKVYLADNIGAGDDGKTSAKENASVTYALELSSSDPVNDTEVEWKIDTSGETAEDSDFDTLSGTATIASGNTSTTFALPVSGDAEFEDDEAADVKLVAATNANLDDSQSDRFTTLTHTIENDDSAPVVSFKNTTSSDTEDAQSLSIVVQLDRKADKDITVDLSTGGTAIGGGTDYAFSPSSVTIPAGNTSATLAPDIKEDALDENDETLTITLSDVSAGTASIGDDDTHTHTIGDDDTPPTVTFTNTAASAREDVAGAQDIEISLSEKSGRDVTVEYSKAGTATEGTDYSDDDNGSITFATSGGASSTTSETITLSVSSDQEGEDDEIVDLGFTSGSITNGDAGPTTTFTFTIVNDDLGFTGPAGVGSPKTNPLWVRADSNVTSSGGSVSAWGDLSGNAHRATAPSGEKPSLTPGAINGHPALSFSGDQVLTGNSVLAGGKTGRSVIVVYKPDKREDDKLLSLNYSNTGSSDGKAFTVTPEIGVRVGGGAKLYKGKPRKKYHITTVRNGRGERVSAVDAYLDGTLLTDTDKNTSDATIDVKGSDYAIGKLKPFASTYYQGEIAEVIAYSSELNEAQRIIIENYLSARYGLSLGNATPDVYAGTYTHQLFGVGAESGGTHPAAAKAGLRLDIASGFEAGDYVMAGHNTSVNSVNTSDVPGCCGARMDRGWELDVTNASTNATVTFTFDLSDAGLNGPAGTAADYKLIKGGQGSWSKIATASSVSGDKITFTDVDVTNRGDGVYTIATANQTDSPLDNDALALTIEGQSGANEADEGWRFVGLPATGGKAQHLEDSNGSQFIDFSYRMAYTWDDANGAWSVAGPGTVLPNGRGFILWIFDETSNYPVDPNITVRLPGSFSGPGDQGVTVGDNSPTADEALDPKATKHLLANPYTVPYDLSALGTPGEDGFKDEVQIWEADSDAGSNDPSGADDGNVGTYVKRSRSQGEKIASWQSFFFFRDGSTSATVTFGKDGRSPGTSPGFIGSKTRANGAESFRQIALRLVGRDEDSTRIALDRAASVLFAAGASRENDYFDTPKLEPPKRKFAVIGPVGAGTDGNTTIKAQESRSLPEGPVEIPLAFKSEGLSGTFTVSAPEWTRIPKEWTVTLVDTRGTADSSDDRRHVLKRGGSGYTFSYSAPKKAARSKRNSGHPSDSKTPGPPAIETLSWTPQNQASKRSRRTSSDSSTAEESLSTRFVLSVDPQSTALPVEMAGFHARVKEENAVLEWKTASETNNSGFYVEHQRLAPGDSAAEKGQWQRVGFVKGAGTSTEANRYRYRTESLDYGRHAFRLRQVDASGNTRYSEVRRIEVSLDQPFSVGPPYPNPARDRATIEVAVKRSQSIQVRMYDVLGREVATLFRDEVPANTSKKIQVPGDRLTSGVYFLRVRGDTFSTTRKMTIVE
jgi:hypothetical protein